MSEPKACSAGSPGDHQIVRNAQGQFVKGVSGNPLGKSVGQRDFLTELQTTLAAIEAKKGDTVIANAWRQAFKRSDVLRDMLYRLPGLRPKELV